jgi:cholesterol transport system auxiliary component
MTRQSTFGVGLVLAACFLSACALTGKADALSPRYFSPEQVASVQKTPNSQQLELQLGQVSSASHLDERIAYRLSGAEVGFYDDRRWTEIPEAYLRRALERELFEQRGLQRIVTGNAPMLDVELTAFEELRGTPTKARVTLSFSVHDERRSLLERSINVEREVTEQAGADPAARLAATLASTLGDAVVSVGALVSAELLAAKVAEASPQQGSVAPAP